MVVEGLDLCARVFYQHIKVNFLVLLYFLIIFIFIKMFSPYGFFSQWFPLKILVFVFAFIFYYCAIDFKSNP